MALERDRWHPSGPTSAFTTGSPRTVSRVASRSLRLEPRFHKPGALDECFAASQVSYAISRLANERSSELIGSDCEG